MSWFKKKKIEKDESLLLPIDYDQAEVILRKTFKKQVVGIIDNRLKTLNQLPQDKKIPKPIKWRRSELYHIKKIIEQAF